MRATLRLVLQSAREQLKRCSELGYAAKSPEYDSLAEQTDNIDKALQGHKDTGAFTKLKSDLQAFINRLSRQQHH